MAVLPFLSGGSATGLSATSAWAEPLPVMLNNTKGRKTVPLFS